MINKSAAKVVSRGNPQRKTDLTSRVVRCSRQQIGQVLAALGRSNFAATETTSLRDLDLTLGELDKASKKLGVYLHGDETIVAIVAQLKPTRH